jgi:hypothetical protein
VSCDRVVAHKMTSGHLIAVACGQPEPGRLIVAPDATEAERHGPWGSRLCLGCNRQVTTEPRDTKRQDHGDDQ